MAKARSSNRPWNKPFQAIRSSIRRKTRIRGKITRVHDGMALRTKKMVSCAYHTSGSGSRTVRITLASG